MYIDTYTWFETRLVPQVGEDFRAYMDRVVPGVMALEPKLTLDEATKAATNGWAANIMKKATKATITLERDIHGYNDSMYIEAWYGDWRVTEVHSAEVPELQITYSSMETATAGSGDIFKIAKSKEDEQLVFGWANVAIDANGQYPIDWDGDFTDPVELEKAAYNFVLKHRVTGEQHQGDVVGELVESVMFTKEKQEALGIPEGIIPEGWWVGFHVPDREVFAKIKSGDYQMFSVEGSAKRLPTQA